MYEWITEVIAGSGGWNVHIQCRFGPLKAKASEMSVGQDFVGSVMEKGSLKDDGGLTEEFNCDCSGQSIARTIRSLLLCHCP